MREVTNRRAEINAIVQRVTAIRAPIDSSVARVELIYTIARGSAAGSAKINVPEPQRIHRREIIQVDTLRARVIYALCPLITKPTSRSPMPALETFPQTATSA